MLTILWGLCGSGKSHTLLSRAAAPGPGKRYLLVPEQFSHDSERALCRAGGDAVSLHAEVLTFGRMADRVFSLCGGAARGVLDRGGRLLTLRLAVDQVADRLTVYRARCRRPEFLSELAATLDELKSYQIQPETLLDAAASAEAAEAARLRDLALLFTVYDAQLAQGPCDPRDRLSLLAETLPGCAAFRDTHWYIDGFARFTPLETAVLEALLPVCGEMTAALTGLPSGDPDGPFSVARETAYALSDMAARAGMQTKIEILSGAPRYQNPALGEIARAFPYEEEPQPDAPVSGVRFISARDVQAECEAAAGLVLSLAQDEGVLYRDIVVAARNMSRYDGVLARTMERYGVPVFLDAKRDILKTPLVSCLLSALEACCHGYSYEAVFSYLKTGLGPLTPDQCDLLENYVLTWRIRGGDWKRTWEGHPRGLGQAFSPEDVTLLEEINHLRRLVIAPLERLKHSGAATAREVAEAVYRFFEEIELPDRLTQKSARLIELQQLQRADETRQLWDLLAGTLSQCVLTLGGLSMTLTAFFELFSLVISQYEVGSIPLSLHQVACGQTDRLRRRAARCVILLGASDDAALPQPSPGLVSPMARKRLLEMGHQLSPDAEGRLAQERDLLYSLLALPSERLFVLYPRQGEDGELSLAPELDALRTSLGVRAEAAEEFEEVTRTSALSPCLAFAAVDSGARAALDLLHTPFPEANRTRGSLPPQAVAALYGDSLRLSASQVESFFACHFLYFLRYGLGVRPRRPGGFTASESGLFAHFALERVVREAMAHGGFGAFSPEEARRVAREAAGEYGQTALAPLLSHSPRFRFLFARMTAGLENMAENMAEELARSDFVPLDTELSFGRREGGLPPVAVAPGVSLVGQVDRVDGFVRDGTLYVRVVDYKTGRKAFSLGQTLHGQNLQMLLYLFALENEGLTRYGARLGADEIAPAGVLYLPAREKILRVDSPRTSDEEIREGLAKELRRKGLLLDEPAVLAAMERDMGAKAEFLPVAYLKDGSLAAQSQVASAARFSLLRRHVEGMLRGMAGELRRGDVSASPLVSGGENHCQHCEYAAACQFDETEGGDRPRYRTAPSDKEFWQMLEKEGEA